MTEHKPNKWLLLGGIFSAIGAILHAAVIIGGPDWYRFFGAGEAMAQMAEKQLWYPTIVTLFITSALFVLALYAWSGAGIIRRLPLLRTGLCAITFVYLFRGAYGIFVALFVEHDFFREFLARPMFMWVSSIICLIFGVCYLLGTWQRWGALSLKS